MEKNKFLKEKITKEFAKKYDLKVPYHTSYPTLGIWSENFSENDFKDAINKLGEKNPIISLYTHFPFCAKRCLFCICHTQITNDRNKIKEFIKYFNLEIENLKKLFENKKFFPKVKEIHFGGGSPSYMDEKEFDCFLECLKKIFDLSELKEAVIEIDPRNVDLKKIEYYKSKGINRISFGIQEFNPKIQKIINRIHTPEEIKKYLAPEIRNGIKSINFDLLCGLPLQTRESFRETLKTVVELNPDRITLLKYAHIPERMPHQNYFNNFKFPDDYENLMIFIDSVEFLTEKGYVHIGINDFVKPNDDLAIAFKNKNLRRDFNGFSVRDITDIFGIGPSSTSGFLNYYVQNSYMDKYYKNIDLKKIPIHRGFKLSKEDLLRREIINKILCDRSLNFKEISNKYEINFKIHFKNEIELLKEMERDGILEIDNECITVTNLGVIFIPHVSSVFDSYFLKGKYKISGP